MAGRRLPMVSQALWSSQTTDSCLSYFAQSFFRTPRILTIGHGAVSTWSESFFHHQDCRMTLCPRAPSREIREKPARNNSTWEIWPSSHTTDRL
jgi:hypothetical protein